MTDSFPSDAVFKLSPIYRLQWEEAQQCDVLLYPEGMVTLNPSASEVLKQLDGLRTVAEVIEALEQKFQETNLQEDVLEFLANALEQGWIKEV